jgi:hypothetical protein
VLNFNGPTSGLFGIRMFFRVLVEPAFDSLEKLLMLPTRDPSLLAGGATVRDDAALAALV